MPFSATRRSSCFDVASQRGGAIAPRRAGWARPCTLLVTLLLLWVSGWQAEATGSGAPTADSASSAALRAALELPHGLRVDGQPVDTRALRQFYQLRGYAPAWGADAGGVERASLLLQALAQADTHGLDPGDYHLEAIRARRTGSLDRNAVEQELLLTDAYLRYATQVRTGRVRPEQVDPDWGITPPSFDAVGALARALSDPQAFAAELASLPPPGDGYVRLVEALGRYRAIAAGTRWPVLPSGSLLRPGSSDVRLPALRDRLAAEGDLAGLASGVDYDDTLEQAVRRFQARHGIAVDGIVGPATLKALNVPVSERIRQIRLNLERWRWLPRDLGRRYIAVNAADATLEVVEDGQTVLASRVVVGDLRHPTPVVRSRLDAVIFNPPWNVPSSIAAKEILPRLRRAPHYLADNDIVILERRESDPFGLTMDWSGVPSNPFPFRLQQQPGPQNSLGRIKFDTPNRFDVYLHDTPARSLFARPLRTSSHGCVRVERARELAAYVLADQAPSGGTPMIDEAIVAGRTQRVPVARPLPVYFFYWTAFVEGGRVVHFREDVYGRDRRLAAALRGGAGGVVPAPDRGDRGCPAAEEEIRR
jgi:murein L,D-transpeptidase YcbB/YkuD